MEKNCKLCGKPIENKGNRKYCVGCSAEANRQNILELNNRKVEKEKIRNDFFKSLDDKTQLEIMLEKTNEIMSNEFEMIRKGGNVESVSKAKKRQT